MAWIYKTAIVIDDAFGPPTAGSVPSDDKDSWFDFVHENEDAQRQLMSAYAHLKQAHFQDLLGTLTASTVHIQDLWERHQRSELPKAGLEGLFATECLNRQATLEKAVLVREFLIEEIGDQNVQTFFDLPSAAEALVQADVAFVNFFWTRTRGPTKLLPESGSTKTPCANRRSYSSCRHEQISIPSSVCGKNFTCEALFLR